MAGGKADTESDKYLDRCFGQSTYTPNATHYLAVYSVAPTNAGGGTEMAGDTYARIAITNNGTNWPPAADGYKYNGAELLFAIAGADWGVMVAWALHAAANGDHLVRWGQINYDSGVEILTGDQLAFDIGDLEIREQ